MAFVFLVFLSLCFECCVLVIFGVGLVSYSSSCRNCLRCASNRICFGFCVFWLFARSCDSAHNTLSCHVFVAMILRCGSSHLIAPCALPWYCASAHFILLCHVFRHDHGLRLIRIYHATFVGRMWRIVSPALWPEKVAHRPREWLASSTNHRRNKYNAAHHLVNFCLSACDLYSDVLAALHSANVRQCFKFCITGGPVFPWILFFSHLHAQRHTCPRFACSGLVSFL